MVEIFKDLNCLKRFEKIWANISNGSKILFLENFEVIKVNYVRVIYLKVKVRVFYYETFVVVKIVNIMILKILNGENFLVIKMVKRLNV